MTPLPFEPVRLFLPLLFLLLAVMVYLTPTGMFLPDEILYSLMARDMAEHGSLAVFNGYDSYPSDALKIKFTSIHDGSLYPTYPPVYAFIAAPFYWLGGIRGLMLLNVLGLVASVGLTYAIALRLFADRSVAVLSAGILLLGSYIWPFALAIWPHMLVMTMSLAACWLHLSGRYFFAGLVVGLVVGVRMDAILILPAIFLPLLLRSPTHWRGMGMTLVGLLPGLALLSVCNHLKFGTWLPFSYGIPIGSRDLATLSPRYFALFGAGLAAMAGLWGVSRTRTEHRRLAALLLLLATGCGMLLFYVFSPLYFGRLLYGLWFNLVDIRLLMIDPIPGSLTVTQGGGVMYYDDFKRALLQSCPFIAVLAVLPFLWNNLTATAKYGVLWLMIVPTGYIVLFSFLAWPGGFEYNMRYLLPTLPFFSILAGFTLTRFLPLRLPRGALTVTALAMALTLAASRFWPTSAREFIANTLPLWLAGSSALVLVLSLRVAALRRLASYALLPALLWGGVTSAAQHIPHYAYLRERTNSTTQHLAPLVADDGLMFGLHGQINGLHFIKPGFRVGHYWQIPQGELPTLIRHHLQQGTHVYIARNVVLEPLQRYLTESGFEVIPLDFPAQPYNLRPAEITLREEPE